MGGGAKDPIVVQSSIALLQERFRQLQRAKEMREEKELLRMLNEPPNRLFINVPTAPSYEPFTFFFQPESGLPLSTASPPQLSFPMALSTERQQFVFSVDRDPDVHQFTVFWEPSSVGRFVQKDRGFRCRHLSSSVKRIVIGPSLCLPLFIYNVMNGILN